MYTQTYMSNIGDKEIEQAVIISGLSGYTGKYKELGGGEINDTFKLELEDRSVILRISKHKDQNSLYREARVLSKINHNRIPKLIFFDTEKTILDRQWIVEDYIAGEAVKRLNKKQFESLGELLAVVHETESRGTDNNLWETLLSNCKTFGDEEFHLNHPSLKLKTLVHKMRAYCNDWQPKFADVPSVLVHGDATPSNVLVQGDDTALIDWELTSYRDAMSEFSTIYYEDMEFNQGKWRIQIRPEEKQALFEGYIAGGGIIDEDRITFWMNHDKMGAALFLYWRIHDSGRAADSEQMQQYQLDLDNLILSLEKNLA